MRQKLAVTLLLTIGSFVLLTLLYIFYQTTRVKRPIFIMEVEYLSEPIFLADQVILTSSGRYYTLDTHTKKVTSINEIPNNSIVGVLKGQIIYCSWENFIVSNPNQTATRFTRRTAKGGRVDQQDYTLTVKPTSCIEEEVIFIDNYPGHPGRRYISEDEELKQLHEGGEDIKITGVYETKISTPNFVIALSTPNVFKEVFLSPDKKEGILYDHNSGVWYFEIDK